MPTLHDELAVTTGCIICNFLESLTPSAADEWRTELALPVKQVGNTAVVTALKRRNVRVTETSVRRHRSRHAPQSI